MLEFSVRFFFQWLFPFLNFLSHFRFIVCYIRFSASMMVFALFSTQLQSVVKRMLCERFEIVLSCFRLACFFLTGNRRRRIFFSRSSQLNIQSKSMQKQSILSFSLHCWFYGWSSAISFWKLIHLNCHYTSTFLRCLLRIRRPIGCWTTCIIAYYQLSRYVI